MWRKYLLSVELLSLLTTVYITAILLAVLLLAPPFRARGILSKPASIIVPFHNEEKTLGALLSSLLQQDTDLKRCEFIFVNDRSTDSSAELVKARLGEFPDAQLIEITTLPDGKFGKKHALEKAIDAAKHEALIFTDADCAVNKGFISSAVAHLAEGADVVIGAAPLSAAEFTARLSQMETFVNHIVAMLGVRTNNPSMAFGRNFAYTKAAFKAAGGFAAIGKAMSGDDDLLLAEFKKHGLNIAFNAEGVATSEAATGRAYARQKTRHFSTLNHVPKRAVLGAAMAHGFHLLFYACFLIEQNYWLFVYKSVADLFLFWTANDHLKFNRTLANWLYFEAFYWLLIPFFGIKGYFTSSEKLTWR